MRGGYGYTHWSTTEIYPAEFNVVSRIDASHILSWLRTRTARELLVVSPFQRVLRADGANGSLLVITANRVSFDGFAVYDDLVDKAMGCDQGNEGKDSGKGFHEHCDCWVRESSS